jgi:phage head maturation protease
MDTTKAISKAQRDAIAASDFAGPERSFPCDTRAHARSAIRLYGKADDPAKIKAAITRILKRKGWDDLIPDAWQAKKDVTMDSTLIHYGGEVKALGDGKVGGYLVTFGDATTPDLSSTRDYFTKETDFDIDPGDRRSVYYAHGMDKQMGVKKIGTLTVTPDDTGIWVEAQLKMRDKYEQAVYDLAAKGKLGWSSGATTHLVRRNAVKTEGGTVHEITHWPLGEGSLTPMPADPRADAFALKSLPAMIGIQPDAEDHTTKALPSGMSYSDLMSFLNDELNEDIGDDDDGPYGPGLYICDLYDDAVVYRDGEDLYRVSYTVTAGNDAQWGTPEPVVRTTVYVAATDDDDEGDTTTVPISGKGVDVTALKGMLRGSMTLNDHADVVRDAMSGFVTRAAGLAETSTKAGRAMSATRHAKLKAAYDGMRTAHTAMEGHLQAINDMLLSTNPDAKKDAEEMDALRTQYIRLQSAQLRMTG